MPIHVQWDNNEYTIIRWDFEGFWNWDLVNQATLQSVELRKEVEGNLEQPVSIILNMEKATMMKTGALSETHKALMLRPENRDLVVVVGRSTYMQTLVDLFRKRYLYLADHFMMAETLNEARRLIRIRQLGHP